MSPKRIESIKELKNVYFLYGDEELLMEESLKRLKELFSAEVDTDFNLEVLDAGEMGAERIIDSSETVPLFSARRLVVAREIDRMTSKDQRKLADYLPDMNPGTTLVLVAHFPGPGERSEQKSIKRLESSALFKEARGVGEALKLTLGKRGRQQKLEDWITDQFKKRGKKIKPAARDLLVEQVGTKLRGLEDAIERICLFAADSEVVAGEDVREVVVPVADQGIFTLVDSVADRRRDISLYLLNKLLRQGESPHRIFSLLLRQFRLIARVKALAQDHDYREISSQVAIPPFLVSKCLKQAKRFSSDRLRSTFLEFRRSQIELYSSKYLSERDYQGSVLEMLILRIIG